MKTLESLMQAISRFGLSYEMSEDGDNVIVKDKVWDNIMPLAQWCLENDFEYWQVLQPTIERGIRGYYKSQKYYSIEIPICEF